MSGSEYGVLVLQEPFVAIANRFLTGLARDEYERLLPT